MIDWPETVKQYHRIGLWHATRYLSCYSHVGSPSTLAQDAVQQAWLELWKRGEFTSGLFITVVYRRAEHVARAYRPVMLTMDRKRGGTRPGRKQGAPRKRETDTFPVQIFGCYIGEITYDEEVRGSRCGDE